MMPRVAALCAFLPVYGSIAALVVGNTVPTGPWPGVAVAVVLVLIVLAWARWVECLAPRELGLTPAARLLPSAVVGLLIAFAVAVPALLFLRFPPLVGQAIEYAPLRTLPHNALLWRTFVWMPVDTAIPEEIAFRGVLLASLRHRFGIRPAVLLMALVFALWHVVVVSRTVALTNLQSEPLLAALGLVGAFVAVGLGGIMFAWLRLTTDHLAASVAAHWTFNGVLLLGLGGGLEPIAAGVF